MLGRRRELRAYRAALKHLATNDFIQADRAAKGTRAERRIIGVICEMTTTIRLMGDYHDRLDAVLDYYGLDEPSQDDLDEADERRFERAARKGTDRRG